jgi:hypothetical protein
MRNLIRMLRGKPVELSPKQEEKMARAQAKADRIIAEREAAGAKARPEYEAFMASQGLEVQPQPAMPTSLSGALQLAADTLREQATDLAESAFDDRRAILDPGPGADMHHPPPEEEDPAKRAELIRGERAARESTRRPFTAPEAPEITFTRIATTGREQFEHVVHALSRFDPADVYGVYRVAERFGLGKGNEGKLYLEWEIAHRPQAHGASAVFTRAFRRDSHWVDRSNGEPSVVDEDVAGALVDRARLNPEDCFGITRQLQLRGETFDDGGLSYRSHIEGVLLFTRHDLEVPHRELMAQAPLATLPPAPFHLEILDWEAVKAWVSPYRYGPARTPSPLPHLPSDPHELLTAYLQIVGVRSEDSYGVQITRSVENLIGDLSTASFRRNLGRKPKLPCVDGQDRERMIVDQHIVIAYRDRPEYVQGRERWRAYQHEALRARLDHLSGVRPPIEVSDNPRPSFLSEVFDMVNPLDPVQAFPKVFNRNERPSLGPYCGTLP